MFDEIAKNNKACESAGGTLASFYTGSVGTIFTIIDDIL